MAHRDTIGEMIERLICLILVIISLNLSRTYIYEFELKSLSGIPVASKTLYFYSFSSFYVVLFCSNLSNGRTMLVETSSFQSEETLFPIFIFIVVVIDSILCWIILWQDSIWCSPFPDSSSFLYNFTWSDIYAIYIMLLGKRLWCEIVSRIRQ